MAGLLCIILDFCLGIVPFLLDCITSLVGIRFQFLGGRIYLCLDIVGCVIDCLACCIRC